MIWFMHFGLSCGTLMSSLELWSGLKVVGFTKSLLVRLKVRICLISFPTTQCEISWLTRTCTKAAGWNGHQIYNSSIHSEIDVYSKHFTGCHFKQHSLTNLTNWAGLTLIDDSYYDVDSQPAHIYCDIINVYVTCMPSSFFFM